ncbi:hypothetical protein [Pseudomonas vancouverensis]|uniref:Uncharacterized protein n=1 Tax=Pseudomonas vancouverensis TaxID=95300 RepID=A0A1H2MP15_PSEVA|nr:hypothetical protein [Pseudomonas vancouverensis]KAB0494607.1 hypothetical protein F7R09_18305 [Pseudomonas vancouverensis]TDB59273.1 hypothetical protein EIY72_19710 [Pseudomonas vancouverensis]SDU94963.1 hypothetical protein SAMN05216558_1058 [Pseudomonas vancouverensis]
MTEQTPKPETTNPGQLNPQDTQDEVVTPAQPPIRKTRSVFADNAADRNRPRDPLDSLGGGNIP